MIYLFIMITVGFLVSQHGFAESSSSVSISPLPNHSLETFSSFHLNTIQTQIKQVADALQQSINDIQTQIKNDNNHNKELIPVINDLKSKLGTIQQRVDSKNDSVLSRLHAISKDMDSLNDMILKMMTEVVVKPEKIFQTINETLTGIRKTIINDMDAIRSMPMQLTDIRGIIQRDITSIHGKIESLTQQISQLNQAYYAFSKDQNTQTHENVASLKQWVLLLLILIIICFLVLLLFFGYINKQLKQLNEQKEEPPLEFSPEIIPGQPSEDDLSEELALFEEAMSAQHDSFLEDLSELENDTKRD